MLRMFTLSKKCTLNRKILDGILEEVELLKKQGHKEEAFDLLYKAALERPANSLLTKAVINFGEELHKEVTFPLIPSVETKKRYTP